MFNLDKLLASRKMQSVELAEKLECTVQTVSRIKNGKIRALRIGSLDRICGETFLEEYKKYHSQ